MYRTLGVVLGLLSWMYVLTRWIMLAAEADVVRARRLWPRSLFWHSVTSADRRSEAAQAEETPLSDGMHVDVTFESSAADERGLPRLDR